MPGRALKSCILLATVTLCFAVPARAIEITDDLGQKIALVKPAGRIIPLYGAFAEMLFSIGAGDAVIARTQADTFPPALALLPSVGTHMNPNVEMILGLKPDLVIQSASRREETPEISRLVDSGIPVAVFSPKTFEDIFTVIERVGLLSGRSQQAAAFSANLAERLRAVRDKLAGITIRPKVFFEIRAEPLTVAGHGSIVQEILKAAGAENAMSSDKAIVQYNLEALLFENPDFYIVQQGPMNRSPVPPAKRAHFDRLKCVREGKVLVADEFIFSRPGPRCVDAVEQLAAALYPERFGK
ncbi:MAG: helical backbone metal receptor [Syntrophobacteraceae bacterium]|jgi:iron complex transport system substrate-binding protein